MKRFFILLMMVSVLFAEGGKEAFKVRMVNLKRGNIYEYVHVYGRVVTDKMGYIVTPMPGKLIKFTKKEGSYYRKDEPVAYVDRNIPGVKTKPLVVKAPFDGILAITYAHVGDMVSQAKPLALFYSRNLYVEANVTSDIIKKVKRNSLCILGAKGSKGRGVVESVSYGVDPMGGMGKIRIRVITYRDLIPGEPVSVSISTNASKNTYIVPLSAIVRRSGKTYVFIYENGKAKKIEVHEGIVSGNMVEINGESLREGMSIITRGAAGLYDGAPVKPEK